MLRAPLFHVGIFLLGEVLAGPGLRVESDSECPTAHEIAAKLGDILDLRGSAPVTERASIVRESGGLRVSLRAADGRVIGERVLSAEESCSELARASAVVLAAWLGDVHPEYIATLPQFPAPPPVSEGEASGKPNPVQSPAAPPASTPESKEPALARAPAVADVAFLPERVSPPAHQAALTLSGAAGVALSSGAAAPLAALGVSWVPAGSAWGACAATMWTGKRTEEFAGGAVDWSRWPVLAGPLLRVAGSGVYLDLSAGAALGWLRLRGRSFLSEATASDATFGSFTTFRFSGRGKVSPFVGATALLWLRSATAYVSPQQAGREVRLPPLDVLLSAGAAFDL